MAHQASTKPTTTKIADGAVVRRDGSTHDNMSATQQATVAVDCVVASFKRTGLALLALSDKIEASMMEHIGNVDRDLIVLGEANATGVTMVAGGEEVEAILKQHKANLARDFSVIRKEKATKVEQMKSLTATLDSAVIAVKERMAFDTREELAAFLDRMDGMAKELQMAMDEEKQ